MPIGTGSKLNLIQIILAFGLASTAFAAAEKPSVVIKSELFWEDDAPWFGGLSGTEISPDGSQLTVISDRGRIMLVDVVRENEVLTGLSITHSVALRDDVGKILRKPFNDAEGLAIASDGTVYISFEGQHRIAAINLADGATETSVPAPTIESMSENAGLEALAINPNGILFALPEGTTTDSFPLYALQNDSWRTIAQIPKRGSFVPVGADFDDQGLLYLLERTVTPLGFRSRIRRFDLDAPDLGEKTLLHTLPARFDNLESIAVWKDPAGQTCLTVISDDNFLSVQRTQVVEFTVME